MSINVGILGVMLTVLTLILMLMIAFGFMEIKRWRSLKRKMEETNSKFNDIVTNAEIRLEDMRNQLPAVDLKEKDTVPAWVKEKFEQFERTLESVQLLGKKPSPEDYLARGNSEYLKHNFDAALLSYEKAIAEKPDYADSWYNKGVTLGVLGRDEDALAAYDKATAVKPDYADAWLNKGATLGELGRYEDALAAYDKAIAIKPNDAEAWSNRGIALGSLGRYEDELVAYDKAISINPNDAQTWLNKGVRLGELGRYEEELTALDKAIAIKPDYAKLHRWLKLEPKLKTSVSSKATMILTAKSMVSEQ